jgi:hypothetical protein
MAVLLINKGCMEPFNMISDTLLKMGQVEYIQKVHIHSVYVTWYIYITWTEFS